MLSHPEKEERSQQPAKARTIFPCDKTLRLKVMELREQPGFSNNQIANRIGVNSSQVSQYLNEVGCVYDGDIAKLERKFNDLLDNEARRRASGVGNDGEQRDPTGPRRV